MPRHSNQTVANTYWSMLIYPQKSTYFLTLAEVMPQVRLLLDRFVVRGVATSSTSVVEGKSIFPLTCISKLVECADMMKNTAQLPLFHLVDNL